MLRDFAVEAGFAVKVEDSMLFTQLEAARARLLGQPVVGEGTRAEGPGEQRGEAGQPGGGGQWGQHQLRGQVERGIGGRRGRQGEQTGQDGEGRRHRQQQESQGRPRAQGAAPPGSASEEGQGREQQRADGGTGGAAGLGGEGQGVREAAGDGAGGSGGLGEGREGEGRGQVDGGEERGRETIGEEAPRDQTGQQPAQQQGPVGRTGRVGTASRIPDLTCRDVGQGLMVLVDVSIADPQREGNVQLRRATPTQIGVAAARRVQEKLRHWGPHLEGLQPAPHFYACVAETFGLLSEPLREFLGLCAKRIAQRRRDRGGGDDGSARIFEAGLTTRLSVALQRAQAQCMIQHAVRQLGGSDDGWMPAPVPLGAGQGTWHHVTGHTPCPLMPSAPPAPTLRVPAPLPPLLTLPAPPRRFPPPAIRSSPPVRSPPLPSPPPSPPLLHASSFPSPTHSTPCPSSIRTLPLVSRPPMLGFSPPCPSPPFPAPHLPPLPAPPTLPPPCPWLPTSLPHLSPLRVLSFSPPCPSLLPALPLIFRPPPPHARFLPSPRLPFFLRASPLLPPCPRLPMPLSLASPLPAPRFFPPCPPSAPPLFSPHPLLLSSLPLISHTPALVSYHPCPSFPPFPLPVAAPPLAPSTPLPPVHPKSHPTAPTLPRLPVSALHPPRPCAASNRPTVVRTGRFFAWASLPGGPPPRWVVHYRPSPLIPHHAPKQAFLPPAPRLPALSTAALCPCVTLAHVIPPPPSPSPGFSLSSPACSPTPLSTTSLLHPPSYLPHSHSAPHTSTSRTSPSSLPFPPSYFRIQCGLHPCILPCQALRGPNCRHLTPRRLSHPHPISTPPAPAPCAIQPPTPASLYLSLTPHCRSYPQPGSTPLAFAPCAVPSPTSSPPSPTPSIFPPPWGSPIRSASFRCPLGPPTFSPPAFQPSHYPLPGSRQLDYPLPFAPSSLFPTLPSPLGSTCPPPPPVEFCPALPTSGPPPVPTLCSPTTTSPPPPHLHYSPPTLPLSTGPQPAPPLGPQSPPTVRPPLPSLPPTAHRFPHPFSISPSQPPAPRPLPGRAAEAAEGGAAKAAREGAMGVVGEGAAEVAEERAAEAAREGAAAAARERAAEAAREGAAGTVTLARQRAEAMETGGGATGAAGKGVTGTGARESAAPAVAREGTAGARVGEGTTVASKVEGEAVAEAAGRAIARPVGAAGAAANAGKHTAGPAETAKGASSKAAAGGVGSEDIGATGEGEVSVVPTGVGTEEGDVIAIEEDEGEDVMHIDGPLAQYLTPDGEADPAPLQPHVEVPPLPPMPVPMLAEGPMEGLGETLRTEPHEGAPILTSRPPAHPPPRAPLPHPHPQVPVVSRGAAKALAFLAEPCSPTPTLLHGQPPSPSPTPDPTVAGGPPGEHAAHLCPHPQGLLRAPRGAARALAFLEEPCSPTPTNTQPPPTGPLPPPPPGPPPTRPSTPTSNPPSRPGSPRVAPLGSHHPLHTARPICSHGAGCFEERGDAHRAPPAWRTTHPPSTHPFGPTAPPSFTNRRGQPGWPPAEEQGQRRQRVSPPRPPNLHSRPAPAPPQGHGSGPAHSPPFCPSRAVSPSQVAAAAIATGMEAVGLRDAPMEDATDSPSHPSHPFHVDDPLPQPMVIGEGQGGLLGQGRQVFETPEKVRAGISDLLAIHRPSSSPAAPTLPVPQDRTRTYAEVTRSVPSFLPPATQPGASLPTPMETDQVLRPCHAHLDGVAPPPVHPVAQEVTSSRDEASAPTETPPPGVAEPSLEPHPAEGQEHTTAHTSGSPPRPPSPASTPVPVRGPALSCATPPLSSLTPPMHGAGESSPPLIPGDPLGAQAAHGVPSTASSDATAPIDPADTATSPDQVVSCPTCRSSLANRRALQHHIPFCHPADAARRAQAAQDTASIIPSLSQPRATGIQFTDAQWQTLDSVDWTEYFSPERIHARPLRRVPERVRGGYLDVLSAILVRIAQDPEAAGPTFLLAAAPTLFLVPATPPDRSHTAAIATRISRFGRGEWAELVSDALGRRTPLPRRTGHRSRTATDPSTADERRIARCLRLAACNETSRACAALESAEAAPDTQGTIQRLQSKHPNAERPTPAWQSSFQGSPLVLSVDHLRRAIFTAPRGSSGGPPEFQCLIPFIGLFYGTPSDLHYRSGTGVVTMHSERGTRQGDPLSPFLYALTQASCFGAGFWWRGMYQLWSYADDTYVLGPPDRVLHHFAEIVRRLGEMGLAAQPHKCLVYQTESFLSRDLEAFTA
ncbi:unnamed protein product [Closterium sp. NIES-65]|nr:unnamed protein product [Closterium sp. NIES-65]